VFFEKLGLEGVYLVEIERHQDERGFFARSFCEEEFAAQDFVSRFVQSSLSFNELRGTVRGVHYSAEPQSETKLIRCTAGAIWDVLVDLRPRSPTYLTAINIELSAENRRALYVPTQIGHGFQTLRDGSEVLYMIDRPYASGSARGIRWSDPAICIEWPMSISRISRKDLEFPDWVG